MNSHSFAHFQAIHDAQLPLDAPCYREPTEAEIVEQTERVLKRWKYDEARFVETVAEVICDAKPSVQAELSSLAHCDDGAALGDAILSMWRVKWMATARQCAIDKLEGNV